MAGRQRRAGPRLTASSATAGPRHPGVPGGDARVSRRACRGPVLDVLSRWRQGPRGTARPAADTVAIPSRRASPASCPVPWDAKPCSPPSHWGARPWWWPRCIWRCPLHDQVTRAAQLAFVQERLPGRGLLLWLGDFNFGDHDPDAWTRLQPGSADHSVELRANPPGPSALRQLGVGPTTPPHLEFSAARSRRGWSDATSRPAVRPLQRLGTWSPHPQATQTRKSRTRHARAPTRPLDRD